MGDRASFLTSSFFSKTNEPNSSKDIKKKDLNSMRLFRPGANAIKLFTAVSYSLQGGKSYQQILTP
jgi:hypothetical protein